MLKEKPLLAGDSKQDALYEQVAATYDVALRRLARAYEAEPDKCRDLLQEIHLALWRSLARFEEKCSLRTWVYRVAHNVATSQALRRRGNAPPLINLEEIEAISDEGEHERWMDQQIAMEQLMELIHRLKPLDRQIILLYLEGFEAIAIGEITGMSPGNVATKIHRIKKLLSQRFHTGGKDDK